MAVYREIKEVPSWHVLGTWLESHEVVGGSYVGTDVGGLRFSAAEQQSLHSPFPGSSVPLLDSPA